MAGLLSLVLLSAASTLVVNAAPSTSERRSEPFAGLGGLNLSQGCQTTLSGLMSAPASRCLNIPGTVAILSTVAGSSWIPPTNTWLSNMCAADSCTADEISSTVAIVADGCSAEFAFAGVTKEFAIQEAVQYFDIAKQALCVRDSGNGNKLCAITTLTALETALGGQPLTPTVVMQKYPLLLANNYALAKQLACTPCAAAAFAIVRPALPQEFLGTIDSFVDAQCGVDFAATPTAGGKISVVTGSQAVLAAQATSIPNSSAQLSAQGAVLGAIGIFSVIVSLF